MQPTTSYLSRIRGVELLPGEMVGAILHTEQGLIAEPATAGRLLVATNRRVISVFEDRRARATMMFPAASVRGVSVRNDARRGLSWRQWASLLIGGVAIYLVLAYWLVDRLPEVIIPVINLHAVAAIIVVLIVLVGWLFWRSLTHSGGNLIQIAGVNWTIDAPCAESNDDLMAFANVVLLLQAGGSVDCIYQPPGLMGCAEWRREGDR